MPTYGKIPMSYVMYSMDNIVHNNIVYQIVKTTSGEERWA